MDHADRSERGSSGPGFGGPMRDWLSHRIAATPDRTALVRAKTGDSWTFGELDRLVAETAGQLAALGVRPGDHVGVVLEPRVEYVRLIHAVARLGATLVPISDRLTPGEVERNLDLADVTTLVCGAETEAVAVEASTDVPVASYDEPRWEGVIDLASIAPKTIAPADWSVSDTMLLLFTSGTTGTPKAVRLTMGNVLANAVASTFRLGLSPDDRWMVTLSLHHMGGIGPILRSPLYGVTTVLREGFDAGGAADDIGKYDVTGVSLVPTMLKQMLDSRGTLADSLRVVLLGGAPAPDELVQRCRNYSVPVYPTYGMTETASQIATATPRQAFSAVGTVGRPLYFTDLSIVDDDGNLVDPGTAGEIVVAGPTVTPGYYGDPDATAEAFTDRGLRTGDVGFRDDDGLLHVLNRKDDRIVTGGENVDPGEVVDVLREFPGIDDAVVLGVPDSEWGERVSALVVPENPDGHVDRTLLEGFCRERLAGFKIPRLIETVDELPRTVSGTIDREAVRKILESARPVDEAEADWTVGDYEPAPGGPGSRSLVVDDAEGPALPSADDADDATDVTDDADESDDDGDESGDRVSDAGGEPDDGDEPDDAGDESGDAEASSDPDESGPTDGDAPGDTDDTDTSAEGHDDRAEASSETDDDE